MSKETKPKSDGKWLYGITRFLVILIAAGAGVLSFDGLAQLAVAAGIRAELAPVWALVIDGFILVATFATFVLKDRTDEERFKKYYAWAVLAVFVIISIFGNALHILPSSAQELPTWVKVCVNGIPPIAFFLAGHLIIIMVSPTAEDKKMKAAAEKRKEREARIAEKKLQVEESRAERELRQAESSIDKPLKPASKPRTTTRRQPQKATPAKEAAVLQPVSTAEKIETPPMLNATAPETPSPAPVEPQEATTEADETVPQYTKAEAIERLIELQLNGESLPPARIVGSWVGLKERSGANILKQAREEAALREDSAVAR